MIKINKENSRGKANHGWLKANHSFSFGNYYNPEKMGFNKLRVINEDFVAPSTGFPTHSHKNMEILTIVLKGTLTHKDSMGNIAQLNPGRIQRMYAGSGVAHSEYNASEKEELNLLQIWIEPNVNNYTPEYNEKEFNPLITGEQIIASSNGENNSLKIYQNVKVSVALLKPDEHLSIESQGDSYIHVIKGNLRLNDQILTYGDSLEISKESINLTSDTESQLLIFKF